MAVTYLELKNRVANRSGRTDGGTASTIRDNAINNAIRDTIANAHPFSWLRRSTTVATDTSGDGDLPANFNPSHKLKAGFVRIVNSGTADDITLLEIPQETFDRVDFGGSNKYYIAYNTSTDRYQLKTTEASKTITVTYYFIPAIMTADADISPLASADAAVYLASARVWLAKERDETNHDRDNALGVDALNKMILADKRANPTRTLYGGLYTANVGFNTPD